MHDAGYVDRRELHCDCGTLLRIGMRFFPEDGAPGVSTLFPALVEERKGGLTTCS